MRSSVGQVSAHPRLLETATVICPVAFEVNHGQVDVGSVRFCGHGGRRDDHPLEEVDA
ncbi:MAG TPA: hypothetical protein VFY70_09120 [Thermomicrobiales bacterium]|nr:hypothetical protein [Thermomicrobiales bacterium]